MRGGQDSDCNPSNAGGVLFTAAGYNRLPPRFVSELIQDRRFSFTDYDFHALVDVCETLARQAVIRAGGRIEKDDKDGEVFVIPVQEPDPSKIEKSWAPGPAADSQFSKRELAQIQGFPILKLVLWALPLLALVALKENRKWSALLIFLPWVIFVGIWTLLSKTISEETLSTVPLGPVIVSLATGLALLCLLGEKIGKVKTFYSYLLTVMILVVAGYSGTVGSNAGRMEASTKISLTTFLYCSGALLLAFTLAARNARKSYRNKRFTAFFLLWAVISQIVCLFIYAGTHWGLVIRIMGKISTAIVWITVIGVVFGLVLFLIVLPYLVLLYRSNLFNGRFRSWLRLPVAQKEP
jgi:hypothetical protein